MAVLKRLAARTQPWRTPDEIENASEIVPFAHCGWMDLPYPVGGWIYPAT